jgi:hypothetical protein
LIFEKFEHHLPHLQKFVTLKLPIANLLSLTLKVDITIVFGTAISSFGVTFFWKTPKLRVFRLFQVVFWRRTRVWKKKFVSWTTKKLVNVLRKKLKNANVTNFACDVFQVGNRLARTLKKVLLNFFSKLFYTKWLC